MSTVTRRYKEIKCLHLCNCRKIPDPSSQKLNWLKAPLSVLVIKKPLDHSVTVAFRDLVIWLIEVGFYGCQFRIVSNIPCNILAVKSVVSAFLESLVVCTKSSKFVYGLASKSPISAELLKIFKKKRLQKVF